jgi:hypothetical protein
LREYRASILESGWLVAMSACSAGNFARGMAIKWIASSCPGGDQRPSLIEVSFA